jgi:enoyl-CoA hydratase/carnithine racemase
MVKMQPGQAKVRMQGIHRIARLLQAGPKPVIAAVEGWATGAGLSLAAACDLVVAASDARFSLPFIKVGLMPDLGSLHTMPARIGVGRTRWMALTGTAIDAGTAERWGLVEQIAAPEWAVSDAVALAGLVAEGAPLAQMATKQMLARGPLSFEDALAGEGEAQALLFMTQDFDEGCRAFRERRRPKFTGN